MSFWINMILFSIIILLLKLYLARGMMQVWGNQIASISYFISSVMIFGIGLYVLFDTFGNGMSQIPWYRNLIISFMISVFLCELLLAVLFLIDDAVWLSGKLVPNTQDISTFGEGRRRFLKIIGVGIMSIPFTSFLYGITKGKYAYRVIQQELWFSDLPASFDGFTLVHISDIHSGSFDNTAAVRRGFDLVSQQQADLILFTGDMVNNKAEEILPYKQMLASLHAPFGKYSVLGNHDYGQNPEVFASEDERHRSISELIQYQKEMGFHVLQNTNDSIQIGQDKIRILGVENWGRQFIQRGDLDAALNGCDAQDFKILLSHDPSHWEEVVRPHEQHIHLTLSGHTHGMQIGIELLGLKWSPIQYVYRKWAGLYKEAQKYLYVNRGFGFLGFAGRVGIPPEITKITLRKAR